MSNQTGLQGIAIVGMAGRFPGAKDVAAFWQNLRAGVESIARFTPEELIAAGATTATLQDPNFVPAGATLEQIDQFDPALFGYGPREAATMDPQHRLFLEVAWEALEKGACNSQTYGGRIGVYAGTGMSTYLTHNLMRSTSLSGATGFQTVIGNDKDYVTTRASYKLNLRGPGITVQTACSTSLVAVALACQSLLTYQCDMALAGGVSIGIPQKTGYLYEEGGILSPDGHCRPFDAKAKGTVPGDGVAIVTLKRLEDALADGNQIWAVIRGFAINNDGEQKIGYTAPSVTGQTEVIAEALAMAGVSAESIGYVEAHGTGTPLGDPIEVEALTNAFRQDTGRKGYCAIGSVKSNVGHLDAAAGVTGLIKAALTLHHKQIPPSLHFEQPNPRINFADSPFFVNTALREWPTGAEPRRAGVSSFGIGGTNVHVVLEEAPAPLPASPSRSWQLLTLSGRTTGALNRASAHLANHLKAHPDLHLADVAYTCAVGRRNLPRRRIILAKDTADAAAMLEAQDPRRVFSAVTPQNTPSVVFLFPGQGAQYPGMARDLYETEPSFRAEVDRCAELLKPLLGTDLRSLLYAGDEGAGRQLEETRYTQPALFVIEYALAKLFLAWGIKPDAMIGHSIGEYVAACLSGVISLEDALALVAARGALMQQTAPGAMLAVPLPAEQVEPLLQGELSLAAVNSPGFCVVSGTPAAIDHLQARLAETGLESRRLHTTRAFHSPLMDPILAQFGEQVRRVRLSAPRIPYISNTTGTWITPEQATDPAYWISHLRQPVRFSQGLETLLTESGRVLLEVGPGQTLSTFARQQPRRSTAISSVRHPQEQQSDAAFLLLALGKLWLAGVAIDWNAFFGQQRRHRLDLPTYPFDHQRCWIEPDGSTNAEVAAAAEATVSAERPELQTPYVAPRTETERQVAVIWQELLGIAQVGVEDNFFELGGHSLMAINLTARLRESFDADLPVRVIFEAPTVAALAARIDDCRREQLAAAIRPVRRSGPVPLAPCQEYLWKFHYTQPDWSWRHNLAFGWRLTGALHIEALRLAFQELVRRHEPMRTSFMLADGIPMQVVNEHVEVDLPIVDLRHVPEVEREEEALRLATLEELARFDLASPSLYRLKLLQMGENEHVLLMIFHQSVGDGWSITPLFDELCACYAAYVAGRTPDLPELPISYTDFADWQRKRLEAGALDREVAYWKAQFKDGIPELPAVDDTRGPEEPIVRSQTLNLRIDVAVSAGLKAMAQQTGGTLFVAILTAINIVLRKRFGSADNVVATYSASRSRPETEPLVGFFVNMLLLRTDLSGNPTCSEALERTRKVAMDAYANQDLPYGMVLDLAKPDWHQSGRPPYRMMFVLYSSHAVTELTGLTQSMFHFRRAASYLGIAANDTPAGLLLGLEFDSDLYSPAEITSFLADLKRVLEGMVAAPDRRLSEIL